MKSKIITGKIASPGTYTLTDAPVKVLALRIETNSEVKVYVGSHLFADVLPNRGIDRTIPEDYAPVGPVYVEVITPKSQTGTTTTDVYIEALIGYVEVKDERKAGDSRADTGSTKGDPGPSGGGPGS